VIFGQLFFNNMILTTFLKIIISPLITSKSISSLMSTFYLYGFPTKREGYVILNIDNYFKLNSFY